MFIFDLGENASEIIKELMRGRSVINYRELTDETSRAFTALRERGNFLYIGIGSKYAEAASNAIAAIWYPRASGASRETETAFEDLYARYKPNEWKDIGALYGELKRISLESQNIAAARMKEILEEEANKEKKHKAEKPLGHYGLQHTPQQIGILRCIHRLSTESGVDRWDSYTDFIDRLTQMEPIIAMGLDRKGVNRIVSLFDKIYLLKDREDGRNPQRGKSMQRVTLLPDRISAKVQEFDAESAQSEEAQVSILHIVYTMFWPSSPYSGLCCRKPHTVFCDDTLCFHCSHSPCNCVFFHDTVCCPLCCQDPHVFLGYGLLVLHMS